MARTAIEQVKLWLFPSVMSLLAAVIWQDVNEIKSDVKALIAQSAADKTRIDNLEKQIENLNSKVFMSTTDNSDAPNNSQQPVVFYKSDIIYENPKKKNGYFKQTTTA